MRPASPRPSSQAEPRSRPRRKTAFAATAAIVAVGAATVTDHRPVNAVLPVRGSVR